ncbi:Tox-REase-5 domain-containing protein [Melittangium boletus]|uniref:Tox-REase-5 domain-containing protein n=1 Tax=Melittangium boletus TaxID=83453 RepID=UPI003DA4E181
MRGRALLGVWLAVWCLGASGCATLAAHEGGAGGFPASPGDVFLQVQEASGLAPDVWHAEGTALDLERARSLWAALARTPPTPRTFAPRRVLAWLLSETLQGGEPVVHAELQRRVRRFERLVLVRPDGYLVTALGGHPLQRRGPVHLVDGQWRVGHLVVGDFYVSHGGVLYPATEALRRANGPPVAELGLERDWLNAALDGAQDAVGEMVVALAETVRHPIRSVEGLAQLPSGVAHLIASSPEYLARYGAMSRQDQIREAARLSTHVLCLLGPGTGSVGRLGGLGAELPALSLSARGELTWAAVRVGSGSAAMVGPGALTVLHMARAPSGKTGRAGPGHWTYKTPTTTSEEALAFQEQVTGRPAWWVYMVEDVEFDGFTGTVLLEAKGPGYCAFFNADGTPKYWYRNSGKFDQMMEQAKRQRDVSIQSGIPMIWHVADAKVAEFLRRLFQKYDWRSIDVRHTPPKQ